MTSYYNVFAECAKAIRDGELIQSVSAKDKEFHFLELVSRPIRNAQDGFRRAGPYHLS